MDKMDFKSGGIYSEEYICLSKNESCIINELLNTINRPNVNVSWYLDDSLTLLRPISQYTVGGGKPVTSTVNEAASPRTAVTGSGNCDMSIWGGVNSDQSVSSTSSWRLYVVGTTGMETGIARGIAMD